MNSPATFAEALDHLRTRGVPEPRLSRLQTITLGDRRFVRGEPGYQLLELGEPERWRLDEVDRNWREPVHMIAARRREQQRARKLAA